MKNFVTIVLVIAMIFATSALAEIQPYGGHDEVWFYEFVDSATITEVTICLGKAYQEAWFANGWHIVAEADASNSLEIENAESATIHVYDSTYWIVDSWTIYNNDDGEQFFWDLVWQIANEEL